ncbi:MAG TPA: adenylate/guanylate cyclase domain-containing protein [Candidatus Rifleibacterium sp.]|nr:adenylate/guanylate cyclase domain-containing protein [Candidatus Rifleibacterium sp.]
MALVISETAPGKAGRINAWFAFAVLLFIPAALAELNAKRSEKGQFAISNGVGIATGQLLMGVMGNEQGRRDFTVTGITVRLAATMEKYSRKARSRKIILCPHSAETAAGSGIKTFKMKDGNAFELA